MTDRGAVGVVLLALTAVAMLAALVVADIGGFLMARSQAAVAADAAALAAAPITFAAFGTSGEPAAAAADIAAANGARVVECRCLIDRGWSPRRVEVVVVREADLVLFGRHDVTAVGAADFDPRALVVSTSAIR